MSDDPSPSRSWLDRLSHLFSGEVRDRDQLLALIREARDGGVVEAETERMLKGAMAVSDSQVRDVMVARAQSVCMDLSMDIDRVLRLALESGHSRFPVFGDDGESVVGIVLAKDLLKLWVGDEASINALLRPVVVVPESKRLDRLLSEFRAERSHMAIVIDEFGVMSGLVTIEDILELIVGEIDDEHDAEDEAQTYITPHGDGRYTVKALTPIAEFNEAFGAELPDDEHDTIGGLVLSQLGHVPDRGEQLSVGGYCFTVVKTDGRRVELLDLALEAA